MNDINKIHFGDDIVSFKKSKNIYDKNVILKPASNLFISKTHINVIYINKNPIYIGTQTISYKL